MPTNDETNVQHIERMEALSERLSLVMRESAKTQVEIAQIAGTSKANINHLISGKTKAINPAWAYNIERRLGYSASWLILGEGERRAVGSQALGGLDYCRVNCR